MIVLSRDTGGLWLFEVGRRRFIPEAEVLSCKQGEVFMPFAGSAEASFQLDALLQSPCGAEMRSAIDAEICRGRVLNGSWTTVFVRHS